MRARVNSNYIKKQITEEQQKAANELVTKMVFEKSYDLARELTAITLYTLHVKHGWGKRRLLEFYYSLIPLLDELRDYYDMKDDSDAGAFICTYKLKNEVGIDMSLLDFKDKLDVVIK